MHKIFVTFISLFLINFSLLAQKVEFVLEKYRDFNEEFYVLSSDMKTKHGSYVKYFQNMAGVAIYEVGNYSNGKKDGPWEYYFNYPVSIARNRANILKEKGAYLNDKKNGTWIYYFLNMESNTTVGASEGVSSKESSDVVIGHDDLRISLIGEFTDGKQTGEWTSFTFSGEPFRKYNYTKNELLFDVNGKDSLLSALSNERPPLYICSPQYLSEEVFLAFDVSSIYSKITRDSSTVVLEIKVSKHGENDAVTLFESNGTKAMEKESIEVLNKVTERWIPGATKGNPIDSSLKMYISWVRNRLSTGKGFENRQYIGFLPE